MNTPALTPLQRRNKRIYGIAAICFALVTIFDLIVAPANLLKTLGSLALAGGWIMLFWFYPFITGKRKYAILGAFVVSITLLVVRIAIGKL